LRPLRFSSVGSAPERAEGIAAEKSRAEQGGYELSMQTESLSDGVKLQYPVLSGMEDSAQQDKVNALFKSHVDSFVKAYPIDAANIAVPGKINVINLIPYVLIIALSLAGMHVAPAMTISVLSGVIIGIFHKDFTFVKSFGIVHTGMTWMRSS